MKFLDYYKNKHLGAGIVFVTPEKKILLLQKNNKKWTFPGGHAEKNETPLQTAIRECVEELGDKIPLKNIQHEPLIINKKNKLLYSFFVFVKKEFIPTLSKEHKKYKWVDINLFDVNKLTNAFAPYWSKYIDRINQ